MIGGPIMTGAEAVAATRLKILSGGALRGLMLGIVPLFERSRAVKLDIEFGLSSVLQRQIEAGAWFDLALLPRQELEGLAAKGRIAPGVTDVTRSTVGLAVRAGAAKPDIATVAAFRQALIAARSIAYSDGPSGAYIAELLCRLGLAEAMQPKTRLTSRPVAELVAAGEAEIGLQQIVAILPVAGAELVGPLPSELQNVIVYAAGIAAASRQPAEAGDFIGFLATEEAKRLIRAKGMAPG